MEHTTPADAGRAGHDYGHVWDRALGFWRRRRTRCGTGAGNRTRALLVYSLSDSGRAGGTVADADLLAVSGIAGTGEACARDLLGTGCGMRAERAHQRADRAGVSGWSDRALPAADGKSAAPATAATGFEHAGFSRNRRALAHSGGI